MLKSKRITVSSLLFATKSALYAHGGEEMIPVVQAIEIAALSGYRRTSQRRKSMTQLEEWLDQYRAELEKNASSRAATIEGLLLAGDYQACHDWLEQWQEEDNSEESPAYKYNQARTLLRLSRCCKGRASAEELKAPSAGLLPETTDSNNRS